MKKFLLGINPLDTDVAALLIRLTLGILCYYGYIKIDNYTEYLTTFPDPIGLGPAISVHLVIFSEFICSILIAMGFLSRLLTIPIIIEMTIVFFIIHADHTWEESALSFFFACIAIVVFVLGSGKYSLDYLWQSRRSWQS